MCKKFSFVRSLVMFAAALTLGFAAASCADDYDDTDLYNRIDELQDEVDELSQKIADLESSLNSQISSILSMINGQVTVTSATLSSDGTYYTIVLSDGTTFDVAVPSEGDGNDDSTSVPVIGVALDSNGNYYWTLDGEPLLDSDGNYIYTAPLVQINSETNELEISTDGGTTWVGTGVYATTSTSLFSSVEVDETLGYVNFTLADGTVIQVPLVSESSDTEESSTQANCYALSGKQYFEYEETKTVKLSVSGVSKATVTRPDGWKASVSGSKLSITAPAEANTYAEQEGTVTVIAIGSDGTTAITDVNVAIGEAPLAISLTTESIDFTFNSDATDYSYYTYGVLKLNSLDEFDPEAIASELESGYPYTYDSNWSTTFEDEYIDVEDGYVYVAYALCCDYQWWSYTFDDAANMVYEVYIPVSVTGEVISTSFDDAVISIVGSGLSTVYYYVTEKDYYYDGEYFISDVNYGYGYTKDVNYKGSFLEYAGWYSFDAGETYVIALMNYEEDKTDYTTDDIIFEMEVTLNDYTYDGTATVTIGEVTATVSSISATVTPGEGVYKYYTLYLSATNAANYSTDQEIIEYMQTYGTVRDGSTVSTVSRSSMNPETAGYIFAVALDENGAFGPLAKAEANTLAITFNTDITITAEATDLTSLNSATITLTVSGGSVATYRYMNMTSSVWTSNTSYGQTDATAANYLATHTASPVKSVDASSLTDGQLTVTTYSYGSSLVAGSSYVLAIIGIDSEGLPTSATHVEYTVGEDASYIRSTLEDGSANPEYTACELTLDASTIEYRSWSDSEWTQVLSDYDEWYNLVEEENTIYGYARIYVEVPEDIAQVCILMDGSDYVTETAWKTRILKILASTASTTISESGYAQSGYIRVPYDLTLYYTWQDTSGNWYESKTALAVPEE